jgi:divalent metal cation (Fe/Co/Zn/Cd) transporter
MDAVASSWCLRPKQRPAGSTGVVSVAELRPRWIGHTLHAEATVAVDRDISVASAHDIAEDVRHAMMHAVPKLSNVIIHVDPCEHDGNRAQVRVERHGSREE